VCISFSILEHFAYTISCSLLLSPGAASENTQTAPRSDLDLLHPDRDQDKREFRGQAAEEVLTLGERDLKANWRRYRAEYEQEMKK